MKTLIATILSLALCAPVMADNRPQQRRGLPTWAKVTIGVGATVGAVVITEKIARGEARREREAELAEQQEALELINGVSCASFMEGRNIEFMLSRQSRHRSTAALEAVQDVFARCQSVPLADPRLIDEIRSRRGYYGRRTELEMPDYVVVVGVEELERERLDSRISTGVYDRARAQDNLYARVRLDVLERIGAGRAADYRVIGSSNGFGAASVGRRIAQNVMGLHRTGRSTRSSGYYALLAAATRAAGDIHWNRAATPVSAGR